MKVRRALEKDLPGIHRLQDIYGHKLLRKEYINKKDISLVVEDDDLIAGFMWAGLMANQTLAHIDHVLIDPAYRGKGLVQRMYKKALTIGAKKGVKEAIGYIRQGDFATAAGFNALKVAAGAHPEPYAHVFLNVEKSLEAIKNG